MKICCISDTHNYKIPLKYMPEADILIHSGDATAKGRIKELAEFNSWLGEISHLYKQIIFVPGNHELLTEYEPNLLKQLVNNAIVLVNEEYYVIDESHNVYKIYGSPVTPPFFNWAYNWNDEDREQLWNSIPDDTDILVTHGPPKYIMDQVYDLINEDVRYTGCKYLAKRVNELNLKLHCFGHIHEEHGVKEVSNLEETNKTIFVNASILNDYYKPAYEPIIVEIT